MSRDFKAPTCFSVCFYKGFPKGEYANVACSIICFWLEGNISSIYSDGNADISAVSLLIWYCSFSSLILSSFVMISFYVICKRFFLKRKGLSDVKVASITKKEYGFAVHFYKDS